MHKQSLSYGLWPSALTPVSLSRRRRLSDLAWDTNGEALVWLEGRSDRGVLVCAAGRGDAPCDLTSELSVRARVGYGGGDMTAAHGNAWFVSGGRIYRQSLRRGSAEPITPGFGAAAAPKVSSDGGWVLFVHTYEDVDCLAIVDSAGSLWPQKLISGNDFYMQPLWHPDGRRVAWVSWNHPQMPWDGATLEMATLRDDGSGVPTVADRIVVAGDEVTSVFQPEFSPDGRHLAYVSDVSGWYGLYLHDLQSGEHSPLVVAEAELGLPAWRQGMRAYAWSPDSTTIYYCRNERGFTRLWSVCVNSGETAPVAAFTDYSSVSQIAVSATGRIAAVVSSPTIPPRIVAYDPVSEVMRLVGRSGAESVPLEHLSEPQDISWDSEEGEPVYGLLYMPRDGRYECSGEPPLVVIVHGGPTGQSTAGYSASAQFFTTRGYAVLEVNYRGSSGYGRNYRNKLRGMWGVHDVDDAVTGARHLAGRGLVDPDRMVIMGGSAGGYTVLQALISYPGTFKAGLCLYGVTNLFTLAADTHKFEQHYLDSIVGRLPEEAERYRERSPIFSADRIVDPVAIFQGEDDRVVPVDQAETIVAALRRNGVPHEYHLYSGEGHGWRKSETIESFYESVSRFLRRHVLFV